MLSHLMYAQRLFANLRQPGSGSSPNALDHGAIGGHHVVAAAAIGDAPTAPLRPPTTTRPTRDDAHRAVAR